MTLSPLFYLLTPRNSLERKGYKASYHAQKTMKNQNLHKKIAAIKRLPRAPQVGLEPTTTRLTAECSAIELLRIIESGDDLSYRAVASQVLSAREVLTSVFGMGTGGTPQPLSPEILCRCHLPSLCPALALYSQLPAFICSGTLRSLSHFRSSKNIQAFLSHPENRTIK